ncbi:hypothetical protein niasHT_033130 [Heterodera trifolii]|uniref:AAA ATPase AAA+ lid domain-containing protein n=1 Tax=Heterodera trifolii TaxID=157864 RepID=A0ABD2IC55_9BILA
MSSEIFKNVNFVELSRCIEDFNGAQCRAVCVEAGMVALRRDSTKILHEDFMDGILETFRRATTFVSYKICFEVFLSPFDFVNERTNEKLTLMKRGDGFMQLFSNDWLLKRCPIGETATAPIKWKNRENWGANFNSVRFDLGGKQHCIGPLSLPAEEEKEEADQSNEK